MVSQLTTESILCCVVLFSLIGNQSQGKKETEICVDREIDKERKAKQSKSDLKLAYILVEPFQTCFSSYYHHHLLAINHSYGQQEVAAEAVNYVTNLQWRLKAVRKFSILDRLI